MPTTATPITTTPCPWTVVVLVAAEDEPEASTAAAPVDALPPVELEDPADDEPVEPEEEEVGEEVEIPGGGDWEVVPTEETAMVEPPERVEGVAVTFQLAVSMPSAWGKERGEEGEGECQCGARVDWKSKEHGRTRDCRVVIAVGCRRVAIAGPLPSA